MRGHDAKRVPTAAVRRHMAACNVTGARDLLVARPRAAPYILSSARREVLCLHVRFSSACAGETRWVGWSSRSQNCNSSRDPQHPHPCSPTTTATPNAQNVGRMTCPSTGMSRRITPRATAAPLTHHHRNTQRSKCRAHGVPVPGHVAPHNAPHDPTLPRPVTPSTTHRGTGPTGPTGPTGLTGLNPTSSYQHTMRGSPLRALAAQTMSLRDQRDFNRITSWVESTQSTSNRFANPTTISLTETTSPVVWPR